MTDPTEGGWPRLGSLESDVLDAMFATDANWVTVHDVTGHLREQGAGRAYNTVMTVMSRLAEKGLLERERVGRAYGYRTVRDTRGGMLEVLAARQWAKLADTVGWDVLLEVVPEVAKERGWWPHLRELVQERIDELRAELDATASS